MPAKKFTIPNNTKLSESRINNVFVAELLNPSFILMQLNFSSAG
jgi:hypothetical protein